MDKAIIFGAFEFLGIHFCKKFLERGYRVTGIPLYVVQDIEEKKLEFGRNANFLEQTFEQWNETKKIDEKPSVIVFLLYDLFMTCNEHILTNKMLFEPIFHYLKEGKGSKDQIILILPIQMAAESKNDEGMRYLEYFNNQITEVAKNVQRMYLPTIFGPWQSSTFLFQNTMLNRLRKNVQLNNVREWIFDAIYIEDVLNPVIEIIESKKNGSFLLESNLSNSWRLCADFLQLEHCFSEDATAHFIKSDDLIEKIQINKLTPIQESLTIQWDHLSRISF